MKTREYSPRQRAFAEWVIKPLVTALFVVAVGGSIIVILAPNALSPIRETFSHLFLRESNGSREFDRTLSAPLAAELKTGGFTLFVRHASRDAVPSLDAIDRASLLNPASVPADFRQGFCLNEIGRLESRLLGQFLRDARIPIGEVLSSPICRARETAELTVGRVDRIDPVLVHAKALADDGERTTQRKRLGELMNHAPIPGTNRIIFAHWDTLDRRDFGELKLEQAGMAIFQHTASGLKLRAVVGLIELMHTQPISPSYQH